MELKALKDQVFYEWTRLHEFEKAIVQPADFKLEVRKRFGDLRFKATWEKALCSFRALNLQFGYLDSYELLTIHLNFQPKDALYEYRYSILEEFLQLPDAVELLRSGLEQLFSADFTPQEREQASGFFRLVEGESRHSGSLDWGPTFLAGRIRELAGTAAN